MPEYVEAALASFQHTYPTKPQYSPHPTAVPNYGHNIQLTKEEETSYPFSATGITHMRRIIRKFH